ncbi:hypothetical protein RND71_009454 [Anisodus tanguticus]|uniref:Uncharacterized protein n=1 Tax=Anisodus tanguticus TaxID=243964 RepID=A0AAE1SI27_9SOLA|nr:hypothetical protein RND71_009454 [Anisodus tanguticus]
MANSVEMNEVVSIELPAPTGWTKRVSRLDFVLLSSSGAELLATDEKDYFEDVTLVNVDFYAAIIVKWCQ